RRLLDSRAHRRRNLRRRPRRQSRRRECQHRAPQSGHQRVCATRGGRAALSLERPPRHHAHALRIRTLRRANHERNDYARATMDADVAKRLAAHAAAELVPEQGVIGLGTGSTTRFFINEIGRLVKEGRKLAAVPTSSRSRDLAISLGIPLLDDLGPWSIDL